VKPLRHHGLVVFHSRAELAAYDNLVPARTDGHGQLRVRTCPRCLKARGWEAFCGHPGHCGCEE
jgi:hypothetical protein